MKEEYSREKEQGYSNKLQQAISHHGGWKQISNSLPEGFLEEQWIVSAN